jgi:hypothetical protein
MLCHATQQQQQQQQIRAQRALISGSLIAVLRGIVKFSILRK